MQSIITQTRHAMDIAKMISSSSTPNLSVILTTEDSKAMIKEVNEKTTAHWNEVTTFEGHPIFVMSKLNFKINRMWPIAQMAHSFVFAHNEIEYVRLPNDRFPRLRQKYPGYIIPISGITSLSDVVMVDGLLFLSTLIAHAPSQD